ARAPRAVLTDPGSEIGPWSNRRFIRVPPNLLGTRVQCITGERFGSDQVSPSSVDTRSENGANLDDRPSVRIELTSPECQVLTPWTISPGWVCHVCESQPEAPLPDAKARTSPLRSPHVPAAAGRGLAVRAGTGRRHGGVRTALHARRRHPR